MVELTEAVFSMQCSFIAKNAASAGRARTLVLAGLRSTLGIRHDETVPCDLQIAAIEKCAIAGRYSGPVVMTRLYREAIMQVSQPLDRTFDRLVGKPIGDKDRVLPLKSKSYINHRIHEMSFRERQGMPHHNQNEGFSFHAVTAYRLGGVAALARRGSR